MKKLTALLLALVMVLAIGSTALASAPDTAGDAYNGASQTTTGSNTIPLTKTIVFINENSSTVYQPNITYQYAIAPVDPGTATVTDDTPDTAKVNAGVAGGVSGVIIPFSSNKTASTDPNGYQITESGDLTVNFAAFQHAGIYRYKITEDSDVTPESVGITRDSTYDNTRYLDVYIGNDGTVDATTNPKGFNLLGAVIFKTVTTDKDGKDAIAHTDTNDQKTTGFEPGKPDGTIGSTDYTDDKTVDRYTTYDFTVTKEVAGSMADKTAEFPFFVTLENTINGAAYSYKADNGEAPETATAGAADTNGTKYTAGATTQTVGTDSDSSTLALKHGDTIKFVGVPSSQSAALSVTVKEYNKTPDKYTLTVKATNPTTSLATDPTDGVMEANNAAALAAAFDLKGNDVAGQTITFTNTIVEVSPTGVVLRFAPYAIMLGAGVALFIILKVRKNKAVEEA